MEDKVRQQLLELLTAQPSLLQELLVKSEPIDRPEPTEAVEPEMAERLTCWIRESCREAGLCGSCRLWYDRDCPVPPRMACGKEEPRDFYDRPITETADRVDALAGEFNQYAAKHPGAAARLYEQICLRLMAEGIQMTVAELPDDLSMKNDRDAE